MINMKQRIAHLVFMSFICILCSCSLFRTENINRNYGAITGCVCDVDVGKGVEKANIIITEPKHLVDQYSRGAVSGKTGIFLMTDIPSGIYNLSATALHFHRSHIQNIRVAPDSISIVRFRMYSSCLENWIEPVQWTESDKTIFSMKEFFHLGKIFDISCD